MKRLIAAAALSLALAGCTTTLQDLEGVEAEHPQTVRVFMNADGFPNVNVVCVEAEGRLIGMLNTTRDYQRTHVLSDADSEAFCNGASVPVVPAEDES